MTIRQLNIEGKTYDFYNDLINIKNFNSNNLKLDKTVFWAMMFIANRLYNKKTTVEC